jgi:hypothetical protein
MYGEKKAAEYLPLSLDAHASEQGENILMQTW